MPLENTEKHIRSGHRDAEEFQQDTLKTITLNEKEGIKAIVGKPKGKDTMEVVSYLFEKGKGWTLEKAKAWFAKHHNPAKEHVYVVLPFTITEKIMQNPLRIRGVGSIDLQAIKKGLRAPSLKIAYALPSDAPINFLQYAKAELNKSLTAQVLYYKDVFASATDIISLLYTGCKFQRATVECSVEDVVKASVELLAQDLTAGTAKITGASYGDQTGAVPFYESYIKKDAASLERVTDWKWTIENNLKQVPVIRTNGHLLKYLQQRHRNLMGELVFEFESKEEFDDVINDAEFTLEFGLGGSNKAVFSGCKWKNATTPTRIEELVSLKAAFVAKTVTIS